MSVNVHYTIVFLIWKSSYSVILIHLGVLDEVKGLVGTQLSSSLAMFEWISPYTLAGVAILGYELHIQVSDELDKSIQTSYNITINETNFSYSKPKDSGNCTIVNITILAINMVGPGHPAEYVFRFTASESMNVFKEFTHMH